MNHGLFPITGAPGLIKSIQRGVITVITGGGAAETSVPVTISTVNTKKSVLMHLGSDSNANTAVDSGVRLELTNERTITATAWAYGAVVTTKVSYQVVEYY